MIEKIGKDKMDDFGIAHYYFYNHIVFKIN